MVVFIDVRITEELVCGREVFIIGGVVKDMVDFLVDSICVRVTGAVVVGNIKDVVGGLVVSFVVGITEEIVFG